MRKVPVCGLDYDHVGNGRTEFPPQAHDDPAKAICYSRWRLHTHQQTNTEIRKRPRPRRMGPCPPQGRCAWQYRASSETYLLSTAIPTACPALEFHQVLSEAVNCELFFPTLLVPMPVNEACHVARCWPSATKQLHEPKCHPQHLNERLGGLINRVQEQSEVEEKAAALRKRMLPMRKWARSRMVLLVLPQLKATCNAAP